MGREILRKKVRKTFFNVNTFAIHRLLRKIMNMIYTFLSISENNFINDLGSEPLTADRF